MENERILEMLLKYIKEQAKQGKAGYYTSIMNNPRKRSDVEKLAEEIVANEEKDVKHTKPDEYTLEDIIDLIITYEIARKTGNGDVFLYAVDDELELIKKGKVFQNYQEKLFPDSKVKQGNKQQGNKQQGNKKQPEKVVFFVCDKL